MSSVLLSESFVERGDIGRWGVIREDYRSMIDLMSIAKWT